LVGKVSPVFGGKAVLGVLGCLCAVVAGFLVLQAANKRMLIRKRYKNLEIESMGFYRCRV
jgi:hypothetical protein